MGNLRIENVFHSSPFSTGLTLAGSPNRSRIGKNRQMQTRYRYTIIAGMALALSIHAQSPTEEAKLLEAIRSGKLKLTDEMIEAQKKLHPELAPYTRQQIKDSITTRAKAAGPSDTTNRERASEPERGSEYERASDREPRSKEGSQDRKNATPPQEVTDGGTPSRFPPGLKRFGYDFFNFNPNASGTGSNSPALPEYVLSQGDEIQVSTWGRENETKTFAIDNDGMFKYPPLQPMRIAGMKFAEAEAAIKREIEKINGLHASVGLGRLKSIRVFVLGEAANPGSYSVPAGATVTTALFQSGGIREIGSLRMIQIKRGGRIIATLDLYEMLLKGNNRTDQQLLSGDVIFVPVAPVQVALTGMVKRPAIYEVKAGTKVLDAIDLAGGLSSNAFKGRVRLDRVENHKRKVVLDVGMEKMASGTNTTLQDGDILNVEEVLAREFDVVYVQGNVNRPGRYEFKKGMTVKDLIPSVRDLKSETFFNYGHIKRRTEDDQRTLLLPFSLKEVLDQGVSVPLMPRDTLIIYSKFDIMDKPEVKISGSVRRPGSSQFVDQMRLSDLILAGGGLTVDAYLPEAHLIRVLKVQESDSLFSTLLKVNLAGLIDNPADTNNVALRPSDSLIVFPRSNFILPKAVTVYGAIKQPGVFELTQNMGLPELISQAQGLTKTTFTLNVEIVRKRIRNDSALEREIHRLNLKDIISGKSRFSLQDGDAIYIRDVVDREGKIIVTLSGELNFPGQYEAAKNERLGSVIRRAGGFTRASYLRGVIFTRKAIKERQLAAIEEISRKLASESEIMLSQTSNEKDRSTIQAAIAQRRALLEEAKTAPYLGRVVVQLDDRFQFETTTDDIVMEDGDSLFIPATPSTISILGEVFSPTNVIVGSRNRSVGKCLDRAGGITEYGDPSNVYYIQPDGSILTPKNTNFFTWRKVEPGGIIIVPPKGPKRDYLDALAKITQIIYQIAISVGVAKTVFSP
jgi:polysaccharide biosynthesis/export protein